MNQLRRQAPDSRSSPLSGPASSSDAGEVVDFFPYLLLLQSRWRTIAFTTVVAVLVTALSTGLLMTKWYRATAIIRPRPKSAMQNRVLGMIGSGVGALGGLGALVGPASDEAEEYMTILSSFGFSTALVERHHLGPELLGHGGWWLAGFFQNQNPDRSRKWQAYRRLTSRFDCEYSSTKGNITLHYLDPDESNAERVLGYYLDDLRDKLRHREIQEATEAIDSMKDAASHTSDSLLQLQLYELIANQTQKLKLAQVQTAFAFSVLESPAAPDKPYSPRRLLDCVLAGVLASLVSATVILASHSFAGRQVEMFDKGDRGFQELANGTNVGSESTDISSNEKSEANIISSRRK
jgi:LPS O-antigen subunit length determinant protein (WzzB/FepE family)